LRTVRPCPQAYRRAIQLRDSAPMNKDQIEGMTKIVVGKVQEEAGNLIGDPKQIVVGVAKQVAGRKQKGRGDVKQKIEDFQKDHPTTH